MGLFRTMTDGDSEIEEFPAFDVSGAAEARAEQAFNEEPFDRTTVYVEDEDGEVLAFEVEVEMAPTFDATESDDEAPADVVQAFKTTRKAGA